MTLPTFITSSYPIFGAPLYYEIRISDIGSFEGNDGIFALLAAIIRRDLTSITADYDRPRIRGYLTASTDTGASKSFDGVISIAGITDDILYKILKDILHSNESVLITDITWEFNFDITRSVCGRLGG